MTLLLSEIPADQFPNVSLMRHRAVRERNDRIVELYKTMTQEEVGEIVGVSKTTVGRVLHKYGVKTRPNHKRSKATVEAEKAKCRVKSVR